MDHIAFTSDDLGSIKQLLDKEKVFYKEDSPAQTGIQQLFFFDPDGNVLEVSNCAPQIGLSIVFFDMSIYYTKLNCTCEYSITQ